MGVEVCEHRTCMRGRPEVPHDRLQAPAKRDEDQQADSQPAAGAVPEEPGHLRAACGRICGGGTPAAAAAAAARGQLDGHRAALRHEDVFGEAEEGRGRAGGGDGVAERGRGVYVAATVVPGVARDAVQEHRCQRSICTGSDIFSMHNVIQQ